MKSIKIILSIAIITIMSLILVNNSYAASTAKITVETANIRKTADTSSAILEQISKGQEVEIIEKSGEWYKIKYKNLEGYLRQDLLEVSNEETVETSNQETNNQDQESNNQNQETNNQSQESNNQNQETNSQSQNNEQQTENNNQTNSEQNGEDKTETNTNNTEKQTNQPGMYTTKDATKLKIMPLINAYDIKEIKKDATVNVLEIYNNWALTESGSDRGWVILSTLQKVEETGENNNESSEQKPEETTTEQNQPEQSQNQVTETKTMYINSEVVNLRKEANTSSDILAKLSKATQVTVVSESNGWSKVQVNGNEGYISSSLLSETKPEVVTSRSLEEPRKELQNNEASTTNTQQAANSEQSNNSQQVASSEQNNNSQQASNSTSSSNSQESNTESSSNKGAEVVAYAKQFLGCKYVYGGTSPSGFDCSGFTQYVYKHFGVNLNRTAESQASNGTAVSKSNLKAGDLVIFTSHVGIYLGDGTFIHAANAKKGVTITSLSDSYYVANYITARRIFN